MFRTAATRDPSRMRRVVNLPRRQIGEAIGWRQLAPFPLKNGAAIRQDRSAPPDFWKQMSDQDRRDGTRSDVGRNQCRTERNQCRTTGIGDGTVTRRHAANGDQGLDTHSGAADLDSGAEDVGDGPICVMRRGEPHAEDAASQRTQLSEGAAAAKRIKSEGTGGIKDGAKGGGDLDAEEAEGQQTQLLEDTTTVQEIKIGDDGGVQVGIKDGNDLDAGDAEGQQGGFTVVGDLDAEDDEG
ncbi:hypothetical protein PF008_g21166 [Phytophthora fragariae]|uniref:Uncharacterized protein n=1 Tax=Phytophthora fragariae TaxID=53985 RepID=A0A6G0QYF1_9STRA|nr:hypothetical protein PF008_g21166 [Phytophthora fragariae]